MAAILATTQVVIRFIGLFAFYSPTNFDPVVHVVLPPIPTGVENHQASVMFPKGSATYSAGWASAPKSFNANWDYLPLDAGDRISFSTPPTTTLPKVPPGLPHLKACSKLTDLSTGFKGPLFASAFATVDIPYGTLDSIAEPAADQSDWRVDTQLTFSNNGPVVVNVAGKVQTRVLVLQPGTCLVLAYVPQSAYIPNTSYVHHGEPHSLAYFAMGNASSLGSCHLYETGSRASDQSHTTRLASHAANPYPIPHPCGTTSSSRNPRAVVQQRPRNLMVDHACPPLPFQPPPGPCPPMAAFMTAECSNSQWP
jgi:hypothetical protein